MTIIEPNKNKKRVNVIFWSSLGLLFSVALLAISAYNRTVNLSHELKLSEEKTMALETENAELKNRRYSLTDVKNLNSAAGVLGLVKTVHPEYLEIASGVSLANR